MSVMQENSIAWGKPKQSTCFYTGNSLHQECRMHNYDENVNYHQFPGRHYCCHQKWVWKE